MADKVKEYYVTELRYWHGDKLMQDWDQISPGGETDFYKAMRAQEKFLSLANGSLKPGKHIDGIPRMLTDIMLAAVDIRIEARLVKYVVTRELVEQEHQVEKVGK